ncbi:MAG: FAD-dependent oxidoreductase [Gemmatimonadetes bacterium]|nr:FAD-dependent oxidoreductase [Gemmatimonadota bacterium]MBP9198573.1 FAD-dependent oxidoreductase [Gemmatimonadales bacterium]MBK6781373.1 FAD-dependent oxidoreductase [Gemmatimonadota bacterium]MBK7716612.1 FAD-dependent oxidoreductase [Gemmatimonadota bacterium]MBK7925368.1 FAD-dependent oxidoreductase [Gemmatimonadota bacterium]
MSTTPAYSVAIIGSGPSGFYAAEHLLKQLPGVALDLYDRLPTPFGLVRGGVAPDHQKIKSVTRVYEKIAAHPGFRFFGHVRIGADLSREELLRHYHAVIYACGAQSDRALGVPGEELPGSHAATEFVGWYNGHPDYRDRVFDLAQESVAVIGMGNVAVDVVRVLARTPAELHGTDIAGHALEALTHSQVRHIHMIGRRGPVQGAFTNPELKELGEMADADILVRPEDLALDPGSAAVLARGDDKGLERNIETLRAFAARRPTGKRKVIHLRFQRSPLELQGAGRVQRMVLGHNRLVSSPGGDIKAEATGERETLETGLVFRSVGYYGTGIPGVAFDGKRGVIPNQQGRVLTADGACAPGEYAVGWIKRGPSGVIGTNKPDAVESADLLLEDAAAGRLNPAAEPGRAGIERLLATRGVRVVGWSDWQRLDQLEQGHGKALGRPRLKFTRVAEMLAALDRA